MPEATTNGAAAQASTSDDSTRGRPYYEKLRRDLRSTIEKKKVNDRDMLDIESRIVRAEASYLEETLSAGNIIKGFDNYIKASSTGGGASMSTGAGTATRRKGGVSDQDRIFSRSSMSWSARDSPAPPLLTNGLHESTTSNSATPTGGTAGSRLHSGPSSARATPARDATGNKADNKNKKKGNKDKDKGDDDDGERPTKRSKISWGRD